MAIWKRLYHYQKVNLFAFSNRVLSEPDTSSMGGVSFFVVLGFQDVAANCICEIPSLPVAQDLFNLKTIHKLSSYENISDRKIFAESAFEPGAAG